MLKITALVSLSLLLTFTKVSSKAEYSKCTVYQNNGEHGVTFKDFISVDSLTHTSSAYLLDLHFTIDTTSQTWILLSPDGTTLDPQSSNVYAIGIAVDSQSKCQIQKGSDVYTFSTPDIYNVPADLQSFFIHVDQDGNVEIGIAGNGTMVSWQDPAPLDVKYFSVTSKSGGVFKFYYNCEDSILPSNSLKVISDCSRCEAAGIKGGCDTYPLSNVPGSDPDYLVDLHYIPRVNSDAFLYLLDDNNNIIYEIGLGTGTNFACQLTKKSTRIIDMDCLGMISGIAPETFWVRMSTDGRIDVGREADNNAFMSWQDPDPTPVAYFTFNTYLDKRGSIFFNCRATSFLN